MRKRSGSVGSFAAMMRAPWAPLAAALTLALPLAAGCGGSEGGASEASASRATVRTAEISGFGTVVADTASKPLYVLTSDPEGKGACTGSCLGDFKPVTVDGDPTVGPGLDADELATSGGQAVYHGHALYSYTGEGLITGAGMKAGKGTWYLLSAKGAPIKTTASGGY